MKAIFYYIGFIFLFISCKEVEKSDSVISEVVSKEGVDIPVYDFEGFDPLLHIDDGKIRVINFWATWCKPCIAELPYFELINDKYGEDEVEVILVSLDIPKHIKTRLIPFVRMQRIQSKVVVLDDPDANGWIPKINKNWSGAIPATIIYNSGTSTFYEQSFTYDELEKEIKKLR